MKISKIIIILFIFFPFGGCDSSSVEGEICLLRFDYTQAPDIDERITLIGRMVYLEVNPYAVEGDLEAVWIRHEGNCTGDTLSFIELGEMTQILHSPRDLVAVTSVSTAEFQICSYEFSTDENVEVMDAAGFGPMLSNVGPGELTVKSRSHCPSRTAIRELLLHINRLED